MTETCPNCGAKMRIYRETLNPGLVGCLIQAIEFVKANNKNEFRLRDLNLTSLSHATNFQKLRYHALIAHVEGKKGFWLITNRGGAFLRGEIAVPLYIKTFRNKIVEHSTELVNISQFRRKFPYFESQFAYEVPRDKVESKKLTPALL